MTLPTTTLLVLLTGATLATDQSPFTNTSIITPETRQNPLAPRPELSVTGFQGLTLCPQEVQADFNEHRIPKRIEQVVCKEKQAKCSTVGQYYCMQLYSEMEVVHLRGNSANRYAERETIQVKYGCFCATRIGFDLYPAGKPPLVK